MTLVQRGENVCVCVWVGGWVGVSSVCGGMCVRVGRCILYICVLMSPCICTDYKHVIPVCSSKNLHV